jgi:hypothetical protein
MKASAKKIRDQLKLPLLDAPVGTGIPVDKQKELTQALMELLLQVAQEDLRIRTEGDEHDEPPQAHA